MQVQCCVCGRIRHNRKWIPLWLADAMSARISHTYCPRCLPGAKQELMAAVRAACAS